MGVENNEIHRYVSRVMNKVLSPIQILSFSMDNVNIIQKMLKSNVYKISGYHIDDQSVMDLVTIMTEVYADYGFYSENPGDVISKLNQQVVIIASKQVVNGIISYRKFLRDSSYLPPVLPQPQNTSSYGMGLEESRVGI